MIGDVALAFGVVFVAELGDKSQLLTLAFAARYRWTTVLLGVAIATGVLMAASVTLGGLVGGALPEELLHRVAGVVFLGFAVWTLVARPDGEEHTAERRAGSRRHLPTVTGTFALAELGDKTMLTAVTLASTRSWLGTWAGATAGMVAANILALVIGDQVGSRLSPRVLRHVAATLFGVVGVLLLVGIG